MLLLCLKNFFKWFACFTESEVGYNDGRVFSLHSEHIWYYSVCPVCLGCWNGWMARVVLHCSDVLHLRKCHLLLFNCYLECDADSSFYKDNLYFNI